MRLAISGVPGSGKSTLCNLISEHTSLELIPEMETAVYREMGFQSVPELFQARGHEGLIENFFLSLKRKVKEEREKKHYVSDKCLLDCGARWFSRMWSTATDAQHDEVRETLELMRGGKFYDEVIYLPLFEKRKVEESDHGRTTDFNQRYQRSLILQGLFSEYNVPFQEYDFKFSDPPEKVISELGLDSFRK